MKKGKKLLALLMVAMLAVSAASCSSNETTSSSESSGTDSSAAASTDGEEKLDVTLSYMASQDYRMRKWSWARSLPRKPALKSIIRSYLPTNTTTC
ncbi:MAG: hypothetical protein ACLVD7_11285 [[Clostridium] leptum]